MSFCIRILFQVALAEKLRLKNSGLRVKRKKLQFHLKQKEESGEVRHEVDFEQLKIENKQFAEKFEARNQELLQLKLKSGNTMQVLNSYKVCCWEGPSCASIRTFICYLCSLPLLRSYRRSCKI